jgi:hypothetical protein
MKRIQVHKKGGSGEQSQYLHVLHDRDKRNTSILSSFAHVWKIVFGGSCVALLCFAVFYASDPVLAGEWSKATLGALTLNGTISSSAVLNFANYISQTTWLQSNSTDISSSKAVPILLPVTIRDGYREGLIEHDSQFEFVWQPPAVLTKPGRGGIVFIAPACKRPATEWFPPSANCTVCRAMPVQARLVQALRNRGFAVAVMAPVENKGKCWHQNDRQQVGLAVQYVRQAMANHFPHNVGVYGIGVENGGVFLGNFAESLGITHQAKLSALCLMNSGIWHMNMKATAFPAVAFLDLARNGDLCEHNNATVHKLRDRGIPATQFFSDPWPISKDYFVPIMSAAQSEAYRDALVQAGYVWPASHVLLKDPTTERYRYDMVDVSRELFSCTSFYDAACNLAILSFHVMVDQLFCYSDTEQDCPGGGRRRVLHAAHQPAHAAAAPGLGLQGGPRRPHRQGRNVNRLCVLVLCCDCPHFYCERGSLM